MCWIQFYDVQGTFTHLFRMRVANKKNKKNNVQHKTQMSPFTTTLKQAYFFNLDIWWGDYEVLLCLDSRAPSRE